MVHCTRHMYSSAPEKQVNCVHEKRNAEVEEDLFVVLT